MPEGPEVKIASDYFNNFFDKNFDIKFEIITQYYNKKYSQLFKTISDKIHTGFSPTFTVGKNIFIKLKDNLLFRFHLGMTGGWSNKLIKHCHFRIFNQNKELFFKDVRKFGKMKIINSTYFKENYNHEYDLLNPSYNFNKHINYLEQTISSKRKICSIMMDQKKFPGVGNYIKSEALYKSKIHPEEQWGKLNRQTKQEIISNTKNIMHESYRLGGAELKDFSNPFHTSKFNLSIYGKTYTKQNNLIQKIKTSDQRMSWVCPIEQKLID